MFFYAVLDKSKANPALARRKIADVEKALEFQSALVARGAVG